MIKNEDEESQDLTAGFGPRHMAINSELKKAYVVFELQSYVGVYTMEEDSGFLAENYLVELMPEPSPGKLVSTNVCIVNHESRNIALRIYS